jgi:pentatricopeptide repeat protein
MKWFLHEKEYHRIISCGKEYRDAGVQFTVHVYNVLLGAYGQICDLDDFVSLLKEMDESGIKFNNTTLSIICKVYSNTKRKRNMFKMLRETVTKNEIPEEMLHDTLLCSFANRGNFKQGLELLAEREAQGLPLTAYTLNQIVKLANKSKQVDKGFELCEAYAAKHNLQMNVHVYNDLLMSCTLLPDSQDSRRAPSLDDAKRASSKRSNRAPSPTRNVDWDRATKLFTTMAQRKVRPDRRTYQMLLRTAAAAGNVEAVAGLLRSSCGLKNDFAGTDEFHLLIPSGGMRSDIVTQILALLADSCDDKQRVQICVDKLREEGVAIDPMWRLVGSS